MGESTRNGQISDLLAASLPKGDQAVVALRKEHFTSQKFTKNSIGEYNVSTFTIFDNNGMMFVALILSICLALSGGFVLQKLLRFLYFLATKKYAEFLENHRAYWFAKLNVSQETNDKEVKDSLLEKSKKQHLGIFKQEIIEVNSTEEHAKTKR